MKTKHFNLLFILLFCSGAASGQQHFAFGLKAKIDIGRSKNSSFVLSGTVGIAKELTVKLINTTSLFSLQIGANLYRGGLGNTKLPNRINDHQIDIFNTFGLTFGRKDSSFNLQRPLYTWNANNATNLENPLKYGLTFATTSIWNILLIAENRKDRPNRAQQIGFMGATIKQVMVGYYNDGPPFSGWLGDGLDRYWTGGGVVHIGGQNKSQFQGVLSFDRFTGYEKTAYEISNILKMKKTLYKDILASSYNRGRIQFNLIDNKSGMGYIFGVIDTKRLDIQYLIHSIAGYPFHPNMYNCGLFLGTQYQINNTFKLK